VAEIWMSVVVDDSLPQRPNILTKVSSQSWSMIRTVEGECVLLARRSGE